MEDILTLGIESSCDETSVAIVKNGREVLSNVINSQIKIHEKFGGVVPEIASRNHIEAISNVKTGQVTFAIKDTNIDGVEIKANQYMALCEKDIKACVPDKLEALKETLNGLVDEDSEIITLIYGEDVNEDEVSKIEEYVEENFDAELECVDGKQPVYSFIVGVE